MKSHPRSAVRAISTALVVVVLVSCGQPIRNVSSPPSDPAAGTCPAATADRWATAPPTGDGPGVRVPQPPAWDSVPELITAAAPIVLRNMSLQQGNYAPALTAVVGDSTNQKTPQLLLDGSYKALTKNHTNPQLKSQQNTVVCGYPALTLNYTVDAAPGGPTQTVTALVIAPTVGAKLYTVAVTSVTTQPNDPTYQRDSQAMLNGTQVLAPT